MITISWFVLGQIFASVALEELNAAAPYDFRTPIYTQVCRDSKLMVQAHLYV